MQNSSSFDFQQFVNNFSSISAETNKVFTNFILSNAQKATQNQNANADPFNITPTFAKAFTELMKEPDFLAQQGMQLYEKTSKLWVEMSTNFLASSEPHGLSQHQDKRFDSNDWQNSPTFAFIKECYLTYADWLLQLAQNVHGLEKNEQNKLEFYTRQFLDAVSPANYLLTNPEVLRATIESNGQNLVQGLKNLAEDIAHGRIGQTDFSVFELGKNLAATAGSVVWQNDVLQLIQYAPSTKVVFEKPLLFIPAWINKFYIADLQPKNSLVKWLVDQGYTLFMISWVNPTQQHSQLGFDDYMQKGLLAAVDKIIELTGSKQVNCMGYCLGGTLLATTMAYLKKHGQNKINASTFLTTMLDFSDVGEISVFIDEEQISKLEQRMNEQGFLEGAEMSLTFNMLRANDLIWSFVINNYLLGKTPFPFDILYWNCDSTRMPAKMHSFYLRNMYLKNLLAKPNSVEVCGTKIDLTQINNPCYFLSTKKDHIAPWKTTYNGAKMLQNAVFTLADSGHVAGVVNPPATADKPAKYHHYVAEKILGTPEDWLKSCAEVSGSWWTSWHEWSKKFSGELIAARLPLQEIEPAPGSYVKQK